jgi:hypothetical protein
MDVTIIIEGKEIKKKFRFASELFDYLSEHSCSNFIFQKEGRIYIEKED